MEVRRLGSVMFRSRLHEPHGMLPCGSLLLAARFTTPGSLSELTSTLAALEAGQTQQQARDTQIQQQLATVTQSLTSLGATVQRVGVTVAVLVGLTLGLCGVLAWVIWHPPELGYVRAVGALDQTIVQQWGSLPKPVQDSFNATYQRIGLPSPGART